MYPTTDITKLLDGLRESLKKANPAELLKNSTFAQSGSATSGLTMYDLEFPAKFLVPVLTPLRNEIPRVKAKGGIQASWRSVTAINSANTRIGTSGGNRGGVQSVTVSDYTSDYKTIGIETSADFQADWAGGTEFDVKAEAVKDGLLALMLGEEAAILGANGGGVALGTCPTPVLADVGTGGTLLHNVTYYAKCVALTPAALSGGSVSATGVPSTISRANADGASTETINGGTSIVSLEASVATANDANDTHSITATVTPVKGAVGYAWFLGTASGTEYIMGLTSVATFTFTAVPNTANQQVSTNFAADKSAETQLFDGLLTQACKSGSNSYYSAVSGTLTGDGAGGIVQIDAMLKDRWDNFKMGPDTLWVSSQQAEDVGKKILANGSSGAQRFSFVSDPEKLAGGIMVDTYRNKFSMAGANTMAIRIHPNLPAGTMLATARSVPYPMSGVGNVIQVKCRQDYFQVEWPRRALRYEYGVYSDQTVQHYFPPSMAVFSDVRAG